MNIPYRRIQYVSLLMRGSLPDGITITERIPHQYRDYWLQLQRYYFVGTHTLYKCRLSENM